MATRIIAMFLMMSFVALAQPITGCGWVTTSGTHYLTADFTIPSSWNGTCLYITGPYIYIEGNNHTITATNNTQTAIWANNAPYVEIRNLTITDPFATSQHANSNMSISNSAGALVTNLKTTRTGVVNIGNSPGSMITNFDLVGPLQGQGNSLAFYGGKVRIDGNQALGTAGMAVWLSDSSSSVIWNIDIDGGWNGIGQQVQGADNGIQLDRVTGTNIAYNTIRNVYCTAIEQVGVFNGNEVHHNTISAYGISAMGSWFDMSMQGNNYHHNSVAGSHQMFQFLWAPRDNPPEPIYFQNNQFHDNSFTPSQGGVESLYFDMSLAQQQAKGFIGGNNSLTANNLTHTSTAARMLPSWIYIDGGMNICNLSYPFGGYTLACQ